MSFWLCEKGKCDAESDRSQTTVENERDWVGLGGVWAKVE